MTAAMVRCALGQMAAASAANVTIVAHVPAASGSELCDTSTVSATTGDTNPDNDTKWSRSR